MAKLKKGSAAAKAKMAKLRAMQGKGKKKAKGDKEGTKADRKEDKRRGGKKKAEKGGY